MAPTPPGIWFQRSGVPDRRKIRLWLTRVFIEEGGNGNETTGHQFHRALIPLGIAGLLLVFPQWFTKKDLKADENKGLSGKLRKIGWGLMAAGVLILIASIGSTLVKK